MLNPREIAQALAGERRPQRAGSGWLTWCPAHADERPSLSVSEDGGKLLVYCHAGCPQEAIVAALKERGLWPQGEGGARGPGPKTSTSGKNGTSGARRQRPKTDTGGAPPGELVAVYDYRGADGKLLFQVLRYRTSDGGKTFRQRRPDPDNPDSWIWGLSAGKYYRRASEGDWYLVNRKSPADAEVTSFPECPRVLYRLPELRTADPSVPVFVLEGEKDVDRLASLGLVATCNPGGVGKWRKELGQWLQGRRVVILPDNDEPGRRHAQEVARALHQVAASVKVVELPGLPEKGDVSDWLAAGKTLEELLALVEAAPEWQPPQAQAQEPIKEGKRETQAEFLVKLAAEAELFHDPSFKAFATIPVGEHYETWPIYSAGFKGWLRERFYRAYDKPPGSQALQDAIDLLAARACFDGPELEVYVRVAHLGDKVYVDLADDLWRAVEITPQGWQVVGRPPVKFRRPRGLAPLPAPEPGGTLDDLRPFINCREEDWPLVVACLVAAFSSGPYPILTLQGEQGTGKTTTARVIKALIDPSQSAQRASPRDVRDLMISAANSWCLSYDNLSSIQPWLSDGFCRLSTGGGLSTRELYTNDDEIILDAMRPQILNGIDSLVSRGDLAERVILLELPLITGTRRSPEAKIWPAFNSVKPKILGALYEAVSTALANFHHTELPELPRMADFALWVVAAESALPWEPGTFLTAYTRNQAAVVEYSLEGDVVAMAVRLLMADREFWQGSPSELLEELEALVPEATRRSKVWPKAANSLSNRLRRAATFLRASGLEIERAKSGERLISIRQVPQKTAQTAQTAQTEEPCGFGPDDPLGGPSPAASIRSSTRKPTVDEDLDDVDDVDDPLQDLSDELGAEVEEDRYVEWRT
ncbi:MAG: hypothetical protein JRI66_11970 [Deltaproteobacteria bacterium]|nr:hypothetical protein [Deltaproteobacteria bacterium]